MPLTPTAFFVVPIPNLRSAIFWASGSILSWESLNGVLNVVEVVGRDYWLEDGSGWKVG